MKATILLLALCMAGTAYAQNYTPAFDVQGHRGFRGLMPENTIPAFIMALDTGVTTLEMDLAVTQDNKLVVSHEPWMSAVICLTPKGEAIAEKDAMRYNIYEMTYDEVKAWDCGSKGNPRFPEQQKMNVSKPLLRDVIVAVENHIKNETRYEVDYNIEIKSLPEGDGKFHPTPAQFSDLVYELIDQYLPWNRVVIQSFDFRVLQYWHEKYPEVRLAALVENTKPVNDNLKALGFRPAIYSPYYELLTKNDIVFLKGLGIKCIPWTVNEPEAMQRLKAWKADGIITDYPDRARALGYTLKRN